MLEVDVIKTKITPILKKHQIRRAGIFGSTVSGETTAASDVDILVELGNEISLLEFVGIKYELEDQLGTKVDLVEYQALKPRLKEQILAEEIRIYGQESQIIYPISLLIKQYSQFFPNCISLRETAVILSQKSN